jgi:sugar porter (SP) family MFS transporter
MLEMGAFVGALFAGIVADKYSRKTSIGVGVLWFLAGAALQTTSFSYSQMVVGRTVGGIGIGFLSSTAPMYVSEISPPNIRGSLLALEGFMIVLGVVVAYYVTYATRYITSDWCFRLPFLLQIIPAIILGIAIYFLPYSPRELAGKSKDQRCLDVLVRLRNLPISDPRIQAEWITIRAEAVHNREAFLERHPTLGGPGWMMELKREIYGWVDLFKPGVIRRTHVGMGIAFFQQFCGVNALIYYSPTLFEQFGLNFELRLDMGGVLNLVQLVAVGITFFVLDRFGRRFWLLQGSCGMSISHIVIAVLVAKFSSNWAGNKAQAWVCVAFMFVFMLSYGVSWSPIAWSLPSEVHTSSYRGKGVALATAVVWISNFAIGLATPPLISNTGYGTFVFFAAFSVLSGVWTYFCVPETKGVALEQMDVLFKSHTAAHDQFIRNEILTLMLADDTSPRRDLAPAPVKDKKTGSAATGTQEWIEQSDFGESSTSRRV